MQSLFIELPLVETFLLLASKVSNQSGNVATTQNTSIPSLVFIKCDVYNSDGKLVDTSRTENKPPSGYRKQELFQVALRVSINSTHKHCFSLFTVTDTASSIAWQELYFPALQSAGEVVLMESPLKVRFSSMQEGLTSKWFVTNKIERMFLLDGGGAEKQVMIGEKLGEFAISSLVCQRVLQLRVNRLQEHLLTANDWATKARLAHSLFSTHQEAVDNDHALVHVGIYRIKNLTQQVTSSDKKNASPFVQVSIANKQLKTERLVGRSNTEYRTNSPIFNSNVNVSACEHAKPRTKFEAFEFGAISQQGGNYLDTFVNPSEEFVVFKVFHERFSVQQGGLSQVLIGWVEVELSKVDMANTFELLLPLLAANNSGVCGELCVSIALSEDRLEKLNPFDGILPLEERKALQKLPPRWMKSYAGLVESELLKLIEMNGNINVRANFKSSAKKKEPPLGVQPTNLHVCQFQTFQKNEHVSCDRYFVTIGAPAAHTLGLGVGAGLHSLYSTSGSFRAGFFAFASASQVGREELKCCVCGESGLAIDMKDVCAKHSGGGKSEVGKSLKNKGKSVLAALVTKTIGASAAEEMRGGGGGGATANNGNNSQETPTRAEWQNHAQLSLKCFIRETVVLCQALSAVIACFLCEVFDNDFDGDVFLIGWESLVSTYGNEMTMLDDMFGISMFLTNAVAFRFVSESREEVTLVEEAGKLVFQLRLNGEMSQCIAPSLAGGKTVSLLCVLYTQGINEQQTIVNMSDKHATKFQTDINVYALNKLIEHSLRFEASNSLDANLKSFSEVVKNQREGEKDVDIFIFADDLVRALKGGRMVSCKSAKDRTGMAVTLEQARCVIGGNATEDKAMLDLANLFREFGVRIAVAYKNIGRAEYAFNSIQRMALPLAYRPPISVISSLSTSVLKSDT